MASEQPSPSESKSKWFGIPSPSVSFVQAFFGFALGFVEADKTNVAFVIPPIPDVPAIPISLKYLNFSEGASVFEIVNDPVVAVDAKGADKSLQITLSPDPWSLKVEVAFADIGQENKSNFNAEMAINPLEVNL